MAQGTAAMNQLSTERLSRTAAVGTRLHVEAYEQGVDMVLQHRGFKPCGRWFVAMAAPVVMVGVAPAVWAAPASHGLSQGVDLTGSLNVRASVPAGLRRVVQRSVSSTAADAFPAAKGYPQTAELAAKGGVSGDAFGFSTKLSSDGQTAVVGADGAGGTGAVYVFTGGKKWKQSAQLSPGGLASGDAFGWATAISGDGSTIVAGAIGHNGYTGSAYVFTFKHGKWKNAGTLTAKDGASGDEFGYSVAVSNDGSTIAVGTNGTSQSANEAYVFTRSGHGYAETGEVTGSDTQSGDSFGYTVALSGDGNTLAAGSPWHDNLTGAAYVFTQSGGSWNQVAELTASNGVANDVFGGVVSLSADGKVLGIGAAGVSSHVGAAYVFTGSGSNWTQQAELQSSDGTPNEYFGHQVSVSGNGKTIAVGSQEHGAAGNAYVFAGKGGSWKQTAEVSGSDSGSGDWFGYSVGLDGNGKELIVGAPFHAGTLGSAYIFGSPTK
jgi:hypothetical protein